MLDAYLPCVSPLTTDSSRKLGASISPSFTRQRYASTGVSWSENTRRHKGMTLAPVFAAARKDANSAAMLSTAGAVLPAAARVALDRVAGGQASMHHGQSGGVRLGTADNPPDRYAPVVARPTVGTCS